MHELTVGKCDQASQTLEVLQDKPLLMMQLMLETMEHGHRV